MANDVRGCNLPSGVRLVSSVTLPEPRKTPRELKHMNPFDRLCVEIFGSNAKPLSEESAWEALRKEDEAARYGSGELDGVMPGSRLYDDGPPGDDDGGEDY